MLLFEKNGLMTLALRYVTRECCRGGLTSEGQLTSTTNVHEVDAQPVLSSISLARWNEQLDKCGVFRVAREDDGTLREREFPRYAKRIGANNRPVRR